MRFADADLIGVPLRVTIGKRLVTEGVLELKVRGTDVAEDVAPADAAARLAALAERA